MDNLITINSASDIPELYRDTPISLLIEYHNLGRSYDTYDSAQLLIGMCMDNRKHLHIPDNFAYVLRSGGANLRYSEFKVSYAIAVGKIRHIALIGHNNCGMVNIESRRDEFVNGLVEHAGWEKKMAENHFSHYEPLYEIEDEKDFILGEAIRLRQRYPRIIIAPLFYIVETGKLFFIEEV
jgi:carbonic anhydrase